MWKPDTPFMSEGPISLWLGSYRAQTFYLIFVCLFLIFFDGRGDEWKIHMYLKDVVAYVQVQYPDMFIIVKFLLVTFLVMTNIYVWLCTRIVALMKSIVLWCCHLICCTMTDKSYLGMINLTCNIWQASQSIFTLSQIWIFY